MRKASVFWNLLFIYLAIIIANVEAQSIYTPQIPDPLTEIWRYTHFEAFDGKGVRTFLQDKEGFNWFGVNDGVIKYDGFQYHHYSEKSGLPNGPVTHLIERKYNNTIYAGTPAGIYKKIADRWIPVIKVDNGNNITIHSLRELSDGTLAIALYDGLLLLKNDKLTFLSIQQKGNSILENQSISTFIELPESCLIDNSFLNISDVLELQNGLIWIAISHNGSGKILEVSPKDLFKGKIGEYKLYDSNSGYKLGEDQKLLKTSKGEIWIVNQSTKRGIYHLKQPNTDLNKWKYIKLHEIFGGDEYTVSISEGSDGTIWVGGLSKMFAFKNGKWEKYNSPEFDIPSSKIFVFPMDNDFIWLTGQQSKVLLVDLSKKRWKSYPGLNFQCTSTKGDEWFLSVNGTVVKHSKGKWFEYNSDHGLIDAPVRIINTSNNQIWVAGSHNGSAATAVLRENHWEKQIHPTLSWGIDHRAVFEDNDGTLWFGGSVDREPQKGHLGGLLKLKNPTEKNFNWKSHQYKENGLQQSNAYGIAQSKDGKIWLGGSYLYNYENEQWQQHDDSYLQQFINTVYSDEFNNLYVGSRFYGVFIYDGKSWKNYGIKDGLESNTITSLAKNNNGKLYAATDNSISSFNGKDWISNIFPSEMNMPNESGDLKTDGNGNVWINKSSREWKRRAYNNSSLREKDYLNFICYRYTPDQYAPNTSISFYNKEVQSSGNTTISWEGEDYMNNTSKSALQYSYSLNGEDWSPFVKENSHVFTGLEPGNYTLFVRARDTDFNIDSNPAKAEFHVVAPVYQQLWFISTIIVFTLILIYLSYKIITKNKHLESLNFSLNEINHELKSKNEYIEKQNKKIINHQSDLENTNKELEHKNVQIEAQRDTLETMLKEIDILSKTKIKFFTNVTHEFRTPLTLIQGPIERLLNDDLKKQDRKNLYGIINRNTKRLKKLINQLLELRKIENGILDLNLQKDDLVNFIKGLKKQFNNLAYQKNIKYNFYKETKDKIIYFDKDKIEKIVFNLLSNAFKFTPQGGSINIKLYEKDINDKEYVAIEVVDSGKGIEKNQLDLIFKRYYRAFDGASYNQFEGTGIGLSYIKELVEFLHGKIEVSSELGKGTSFFIFLPTDLEPTDKQIIKDEFHLEDFEEELNNLENAAENLELPSEDTSRQAVNILLVEDNSDMKMYLSDILKNYYQVTVASDGKEALDFCKKHDFDLIISDIMMPGMDGLTFCKKIKSEFETSHIPVILLTAKVMEENKIEGYEHGADAYITKPFNSQLLIVRIEKLLESREILKRKFNSDFSLEPKEILVSSEDDKFLIRLTELMEKHISDSNFDVNKLCEMSNKTHIQFIRKTKQLTGKKPAELLRNFRIKRAIQLIEQNKLSISDIAYMVGYDLPNSFSRAFKKEVGVSPTEYILSISKPVS